MPGPPGHAQAARHTVAIVLENARQFQQRGVADRVVPYTDVPGIQMAMHQHETLRLDVALDLGDQAGALEPALFQFRVQCNLESALFHLL